MLLSICWRESSKINERLNWHKTGPENLNECGFLLNTSDHFHKNMCKNSPCTIQFFLKKDGNGRTARDALITLRRKLR